LTEETPPHPNTLYGEVKLGTERHLLSMAGADFRPIVLRVTGVYGTAGSGREHKWSGLVEDYLAGRAVASRVATEVHGRDLAQAVFQLTAAGEAGVFNVSDIVVDRADLLAAVAEATRSRWPLPSHADAGLLNIMATDKLRALGWQPGGQALLEREIRSMVAERSSSVDSDP
jgi:dTDP-4-dehydrorhamnose reductase